MGWREWEKKEDGISEYDDFPSKREKLPRSSNLVPTSDRRPRPSFLIPPHLYQGQAGRSPVLHKDFTLFCGQSNSGYLQKSWDGCHLQKVYALTCWMVSVPSSHCAFSVTALGLDFCVAPSLLLHRRPPFRACPGLLHHLLQRVHTIKNNCAIFF